MERGEIIRIAAMTGYNVNSEYCRDLGDPDARTWYGLPRHKRDVYIKGVEGVLLGNGPEQWHESWLRQNTADGWTLGPVKDPEKKEHPCMVPYGQLSIIQRTKDLLFVFAVRGVLVHHGLLAE